MYKESKWAKEIISQQKPNGMWGDLHSLSEPSRKPITTEEALRRLKILGYSAEDECIIRALDYLNNCISDKTLIPERPEKLHNWDILTDMILATWIRCFTRDNTLANEIAMNWARIINFAFANGAYNHDAYETAYGNTFAIKPKGGRLVDFVNFYQISLIADCLNAGIEEMVVDYIMSRNGIYYVYNDFLFALPSNFMSKQASHYLAAIELMAAYQRSKHKLYFVVDWLNGCKNERGVWDMGAKAKDGIYFPLSDSWRSKTAREADCTYRVQKLIDKITGE